MTMIPVMMKQPGAIAPDSRSQKKARGICRSRLEYTTRKAQIAKYGQPESK